MRCKACLHIKAWGNRVPRGEATERAEWDRRTKCGRRRSGKRSGKEEQEVAACTQQMGWGRRHTAGERQQQRGADVGEVKEQYTGR